MPDVLKAVYKLSFDERSGPPKKTFRFFLEHLDTGKRKQMQLTTDVGWHIHAILEEAYNCVEGVGNCTIIPTVATVKMWSNIWLKKEKKNG